MSVIEKKTGAGASKANGKTDLKKDIDPKQERADAPEQTIVEVDAPMYLMNVPYSFSAGQANNVWMTEVDDEKRTVDSDKAMAQFLDLYHFIAADAVVYLLPATETWRTPGPGLHGQPRCCSGAPA